MNHTNAFCDPSALKFDWLACAVIFPWFLLAYRDCFSTDLRAAFSTNVRIVGTARKIDITDCSGVTFLIDKVVREVRALRCHLCKFVVGWHMPFFSLESCSDSIIVSNIADEAGQIIETAKCSGINLRCVCGLGFVI